MLVRIKQKKEATEVAQVQRIDPIILLEKETVAAYCRVSTDSKDQMNSYQTQIAYYTQLIAENPEWELVDIYADEGLSGTDMKKREEQNRLIRDCKLGKIDRVITKSVSRFARNTQELLVALRTLKDLGVSIYFEEQGIDSEKMNMEMLVTFPGIAAQQESVNISDHLRRSYQMRMESGEFNCCAPAYGYDLVNGQLVVKEDEAAVIRRIFDLYLQGIGKQNIANILNTESVPRRYAQKKCYHNTINYVINNERYMGDAIINKTYIVDCLSKKVKRNDGGRCVTGGCHGGNHAHGKAECRCARHLETSHRHGAEE